MQYYAGTDLHTRKSVVCVIDEKERKLVTATAPNCDKAIQRADEQELFSWFTHPGIRASLEMELERIRLFSRELKTVGNPQVLRFGRRNKKSRHMSSSL